MNFAHLSPLLEWDLAPCTQGCQDIIGPIPPSFLISLMQIKGIFFYQVGLVPTPLLYYSMYYKKLDSGIMITGSHNPPNYNGFKMLLKNKSIVGKDILDIAKISSKGDFCKNKKGVLKKISLSNTKLMNLIFNNKETLVDL